MFSFFISSIPIFVDRRCLILLPLFANYHYQLLLLKIFTEGSPSAVASLHETLHLNTKTSKISS